MMPASSASADPLRRPSIWAARSGPSGRSESIRMVAKLQKGWGWSAVANGYLQAALAERDSGRAEELRAAGRQAEDKALALDRNNSEALAHRAYLIDQHDWAGQEAMFKSAITAKPLDC